MNPPTYPLQWSAQFGPSLTNSYDQRQQFDRGIKNPEGQSNIRSPIPPDPGYGTDDRARSAPIPSVRLHGSAAKQNYKRATASTGAPYRLGVHCSTMFQTSNKIGKPPKNHLNENLKRIRRIMRQTQKKQTIKEEKSKPMPAKALWQSKQYTHVQSKVKQKLDEDNQRSESRPQSTQVDFLRAHANTGPQCLRSQSVSSARRDSVASSVNTTTSQTNDKTKPDFVKVNSRYVKTLPKTRKTISTEAVEEVQEKQAKQLKSYQEKQKGRVPDYIEKIKEKRDQDVYETLANAPDPDCPRGHTKVDANQRVATLQQLQSNRAELLKRLSQLPVRNDTVVLRRTKEEIEKKIVEMDEAIQIFSKPKVFIIMNE